MDNIVINIQGKDLIKMVVMKTKESTGDTSGLETITISFGVKEGHSTSKRAKILGRNRVDTPTLSRTKVIRTMWKMITNKITIGTSMRENMVGKSSTSKISNAISDNLFDGSFSKSIRRRTMRNTRVQSDTIVRTKHFEGLGCKEGSIVRMQDEMTKVTRQTNSIIKGFEDVLKENIVVG